MQQLALLLLLENQVVLFGTVAMEGLQRLHFVLPLDRGVFVSDAIS